MSNQSSVDGGVRVYLSYDSDGLAAIALDRRPNSDKSATEALVIPPLGGYFDRFAKSLHLSKFVRLF